VKEFFPARRLLAAQALVLVLALTACSPRPADSENLRGGNNVQSAMKAGTGEIRHQLEPLTARFPQLVGAASATWMSGTIGDSHVPGPSTYWIDAIVDLPEPEYAELSESVSATELPLPEDFSPQLKGAIPTGQLLTSSDLNKGFSQGRFVCTVYLVTNGRTLILSTRFQ
jgi:hypothetical protein